MGKREIVTKKDLSFINILGYNIYSNNLSKLSLEIENQKRPFIINTINPHSYIVAKKDVVFQKALKESDILLPDGIGIVWAVKFLTGQKIRRIAGADLHEYLLQKLDKEGGKVFYLGSMESTLKKIENRLGIEYPNIQFDCFSPPYKTEFNNEDSQIMINKVNNFRSDILFIGMTAPKQEKWVNAFRNQLDANVIASIGAVFDFYAGTVKRAPVWMQKMGFEWLHRFLLNPKRMWKRYIINNFKFIYYIFQAKTKKEVIMNFKEEPKEAFPYQPPSEKGRLGVVS